MKKKNNKIIKYIVIAISLILILVLGIFIFNGIFSNSSNSRLEEVKNYKLSKKEKLAISDSFKEIEQIKDIEVYTNIKIIKVMITLSEDVDFDIIKDNSNKIIEYIDEENLKFFDIEIFVKSENDESDVYPKIGYKHKSNNEFSW